jgi:hypothetical protein
MELETATYPHTLPLPLPALTTQDVNAQIQHQSVLFVKYSHTTPQHTPTGPPSHHLSPRAHHLPTCCLTTCPRAYLASSFAHHAGCQRTDPVSECVVRKIHSHTTPPHLHTTCPPRAHHVLTTQDVNAQIQHQSVLFVKFTVTTTTQHLHVSTTPLVPTTTHTHLTT